MYSLLGILSLITAKKEPRSNWLRISLGLLNCKLIQLKPLPGQVGPQPGYEKGLLTQMLFNSSGTVSKDYLGLLLHTNVSVSPGMWSF